MGRFELDRIALWAIVIIAFTVVIFMGVYPLFSLTLDPSLANVLSGCIGALFTFLRMSPNPKNEEEPQAPKEQKEDK